MVGPAWFKMGSLAAARMWVSENERLGLKRCTPIGYVFVELAFVTYISTGITFFLGGAVILVKTFSSGFAGRMLLVFLLPALLALVTWILNSTAWRLARRKGFAYDYESDKCTWTES